MKTLLFLMLLAVPVMAQNPDVPDAAFALDLGIGAALSDDTLPLMSMEESRFRAAILMPISDRLTISARMDLKDVALRKYQEDGLWKFRAQTAFWEIGCKIYIGKKNPGGQ